MKWCWCAAASLCGLRCSGWRAACVRAGDCWRSSDAERVYASAFGCPATSGGSGERDCAFWIPVRPTRLQPRGPIQQRLPIAYLGNRSVATRLNRLSAHLPRARLHLGRPFLVRISGAFFFLANRKYTTPRVQSNVFLDLSLRRTNFSHHRGASHRATALSVSKQQDLEKKLTYVRGNAYHSTAGKANSGSNREDWSSCPMHQHDSHTHYKRLL